MSTDREMRPTPPHLTDLIELLPDAALLLQPDGHILHANAIALALYGYALTELQGLSIRALRAPETHQDIDSKLDLVHTSILRFETMHRRKDGSTFPVEVSARSSQFEGEEILLSVIRDITDRKRQERALKQSEHMFSQVFHGSPGCCAITTVSDGRMIDVNEPFALSAGYPREELIGRTITELGLGDPEQSRLVREHLRDGRVTALQTVARDRSGNTRYALFSAAMIDVDGTLCIFSESIDITERVQAEAALRESITQRKRTDEQLELVKTSIDRAPLPAFWFSAAGDIVYVNDEACRALGYTKDELLNMHALGINPNATPERWAAAFAQIKANNTYSLQSALLCKDGTPFPAELTSTYFQSGGREYCLGFAIGLAERIRAQAEKDALQAQLHQAQRLESVGRLAGGVAHDFNNLLTIIQMSTQQAIDKVDTSLPLYADLRDICVAAERSTKLTRQLLAFASRQTITPKALDLNASVASMLAMLRRLVGENLDIIWRPELSLWPVLMDPSQIDQILANLCVNARDAIADIGTITIETSNKNLHDSALIHHPGASPGYYVQLRISDTGSGMDPDTLSHIFEPFFTTKPEGKGTGLGLPTVYGIVKQNNGFIDVASTPQKGSTFTIYLPRYTGQTSPTPSEPSRPTSSHRETILVVEDESVILRLITKLLTNLGYHVLASLSPSDAIRIAAEQPQTIHLLLTDVIMPETNGRDLAKHLQSLYPTIRCLFMSGYSADIIAHHGVIEPGLAFIEKPFTVNELAAKVRAVLDA